MPIPSDTIAYKTFGQIESEVSRMYREARKDIVAKMNDFTRHHKAKDKEMQRGLKKGTVTQAQYQQWLKGQVFVGNQWKSKKAYIDATIANVMNEASAIVHDKSKEVFAENANYTAYEIEQNCGGAVNFDLYDKITVDMLLRDDPELLIRKTDADGNKLEAWNTKTIDNAISQGIIQGESINQISQRIARNLCIKADRSTLLYARTAMTCAQNAGRIERMKDAEEAGIKMLKVWISTMDERTRSAHQELDGQEVPVNQPFSSMLGPIDFPGDPGADPENVWNCRCALGYNYPEYRNRDIERTAYYEEGDPEYDPDHRNYEVVKNMTYQQWVEYKQNQIKQRYDGSSTVPVKPVVSLRETRITDIMNSHTVDQMTPEQKQEFTEVLGGMTDDMLELYTYMVKFHENNNYTNGGGWYSPSDKKVEMTLKDNKWEKAIGLSELTGAWKTKFHEELHQLDHILGITWGNGPFSSATACEAGWFNYHPTDMGLRMKDAITKDIISFFNKAIDKYVADANNPNFKLAHITDIDKPIKRDVKFGVFNLLNSETGTGVQGQTNRALMSAFTDAIGLATRGRVDPYAEGFWGHNNSYQASRGINGATSELFAEIGSHIMRNDTEALGYLEKYMPNTIAEYKNSLGEILDYVRNNTIGY